MSLVDGMAAMNLEMPARVPRTEYSAEGHWALIKAVTRIDASAESPKPVQAMARRAFIKSGNYDFIWSILVNGKIFGDTRTKMGHAVYAAGGVDYNSDIL